MKKLSEMGSTGVIPVCYKIKYFRQDERYPQGVGSDDVMTQSVVCVPLTLPSQDLICEFTQSDL